MPMVAWYMLSKESYIKRVIKDVLPTLCSPRKTSLNFFKGFEYEPTVDCDAMMAGTGKENVKLEKKEGEAEKRRENDAFARQKQRH